MWNSYKRKISYEGSLRSNTQQFYCEILGLASYCYCGDSLSNTDPFQNTIFKERNLSCHVIVI